MRNDNENGGMSEGTAEQRRAEASEGERSAADKVRRGDETSEDAGSTAGLNGRKGDSGEPIKPEPWDRLEHALAEQLTGGPLEDADSEQRLKDRISPRYEIRIQTELDPIVEETKQYRKLAQEIDDRYDRFDK